MTPGPGQVAQRTPPWVVVAWVGVSFLACICGIGGGLFAVPLLHYGARLPLRTAVGSSLCLVFVLSLAATVTEALVPESQLAPLVVALLVAGALPGSQVGFWVSLRMKTLALKSLFALVLVAAGLQVLATDARAGQVAGELSGGELALVALIGFAGGFLTPILGIGGGLVVVPALFLGFPTIGYVEARASSLALAVVASAWSVRNFVRSSEVDLRAVLPLMGATVVGAVLGVKAVHLAGWAEFARMALGVVLLLVAVRFARDALRSSADRRAAAEEGGTARPGGHPGA